MKNTFLILFSIILLNTASSFAQFGKFGELDLSFGMLYEGMPEYTNETLSLQNETYYNKVRTSLFGGQLEYTRGFLLTPQIVFNSGLGYAYQKQSFNITDKNYGSVFDDKHEDPSLGAVMQPSPHYITIPFRISFWNNTVRYRNGEISTADSADYIFGFDIGGKVLYALGLPKVYEIKSAGVLTVNQTDNNLYINSLLNEMSGNVNRLFFLSRVAIRLKMSTRFSVNMVVTYSFSKTYDNNTVHFIHNGTEQEFRYYLDDENEFRLGLGTFLGLSFEL